MLDHGCVGFTSKCKQYIYCLHYMCVCLANEIVFLRKARGINVLSGMTGLCLAERRTPVQAENLLDIVLAVRLNRGNTQRRVP